MKIVVEVDGKELTYESGGYPVKVGDTVILSTPKWKRDMGEEDTFEAEVVAVGGTSYRGPVKPIIGVKFPVIVGDAEIIDLIRDASVIVIDGKTYTRKTGWALN